MDELTITRAELAKFLDNDQDLIIRFERLFEKTTDEIPGELQELQQNLAANESARNAIIGKLDRLIEIIGKAPANPAPRRQDKIDVLNTSAVAEESISPPAIPNRGLTGTYHSSGSNQFIIENGLIVGIT